MSSTYRPLGDYLTGQPGPTCGLTFREVEVCLGRPLPPSACTRRDWWTNREFPSHAYHGWISVGWRIASVDLEGQVVTFRKG